jgi:hypothetical protein
VRVDALGELPLMLQRRVLVDELGLLRGLAGADHQVLELRDGVGGEGVDLLDGGDRPLVGRLAVRVLGGARGAACRLVVGRGLEDRLQQAVRLGDRGGRPGGLRPSARQVRIPGAVISSTTTPNAAASTNSPPSSPPPPARAGRVALRGR